MTLECFLVTPQITSGGREKRDVAGPTEADLTQSSIYDPFTADPACAHIRNSLGIPIKSLLGRSFSLFRQRRQYGERLRREPPHMALVRKHAAPDGGFATASRVGSAGRRNQSGRRMELRRGVRESGPKGASHGFWAGKGPAGYDRVLVLEEMRKDCERRRPRVLGEMKKMVSTILLRCILIRSSEPRL